MPGEQLFDPGFEEREIEKEKGDYKELIRQLVNVEADQLPSNALDESNEEMRRIVLSTKKGDRLIVESDIFKDRGEGVEPYFMVYLRRAEDEGADTHGEYFAVEKIFDVEEGDNVLRVTESSNRENDFRNEINNRLKTTEQSAVAEQLSGLQDIDWERASSKEIHEVVTMLRELRDEIAPLDLPKI